MKKIKIIQLVENLGVGGIEKIVTAISGNLKGGKYDVEVWCADEAGELAGGLLDRGIEVKVLKMRSCYDPRSILELAALFRKAGPDILHTHTYFVNTIGRFAAILAGIPRVVTHVHNTYQGHYTAMNIFVERLLNRFTDRIICCSDAVKDFVF